MLEFVGFQTMGILVPYGIIFDAVGVFGHLLFKSCSTNSAPPPLQHPWNDKCRNYHVSCPPHLHYMFLLSTAKIISKMSVILAPITHWHTQSKVSVCECYFVYKIVLTVCEKILFLKSRKTFEIPRTIYPNSALQWKVSTIFETECLF